MQLNAEAFEKRALAMQRQTKLVLSADNLC